MILQLAIIILGFAVLSKSADEALRRLVLLSRHFGIAEFSISFIVVGIVSTFPELSISLNSAFDGFPTLGLGVIFGSNIADLTLVMGMVALMGGGIKLRHPIIKETIWILLATALPVVLLLDGELSRLDGIILLAAFAIYLSRLLQHSAAKPDRRVECRVNVFNEGAMTLICVAAIIISGMVITDAAEEISIGMGAPLFFIGTLLAIGTCLPELVFAIKATNHNHGDLGVGDILGNVLADCMGVLGLVAIVSPIRPSYPQLAILSGGLAVLSMLLLLMIFQIRGSIGKKEGLALVMLYILFLALQAFAEHIAVAGAAAA